MTRRQNTPRRCTRCRMHLSLCFCDEIVPQQTIARLCLVLHREESKRTTNTGRIAALCLSSSTTLIHGVPHEPTVAPDWSQTRPVLLWPSLGATPLGDLAPLDDSGRPLTLVVPDANWRQASRMTRRLSFLSTLPRVTLPEGPVSSYRLRSEPTEGGLATMEAIARAFGVLERQRGPAVQAHLEHVLRLMVERTLFSRGLLERKDVYGGISDAVKLHEPGVRIVSQE